MKTFIKRTWALGAIVFMVFSLLGSREAQAGPGGNVSFQVFYDELSPHGRWINDPEFGYVWAPRVERDFQPYATRGHWVMTDYGNTWVSDYDWGWAPFHYGRWKYDDFYGWLWVPGQEWGPAWVDWRHTDGYYGWAPMAPRATIVVAPVRWVFVPVMYITSPRVYSYYVPRTQVVNIYYRTTIINNYYERDNRRYVYGPRNRDIERATNRKVNVYRVENDSRAGRTALADNSVRIYRPEVRSRQEDAPVRVETRDNATRSRFTDNNGTMTRTDRGSNQGRTTSGEEAGTVRSRSVEGREVEAFSRTPSEASTAPRSEEGRRSRVREVEPRTSHPAEQKEESAPRPAGIEYSRRSRTMESTGTQSRSMGETPATRAEGNYPTRRAEAPAQGQYQRNRLETGTQGQYQQRSRQMASPAQAPAQRGTTSRSESSSRREGGRSGRN
ncbi:DUF6600 domain-containing protein [Rufibacter immobilis]|uniref:DUF6600 domain-containing protein n=1 Tax=Rufibacter immobilis TaxID=1348778 RepID=UPI0035F0995A